MCSPLPEFVDFLFGQVDCGELIFRRQFVELIVLERKRNVLSSNELDPSGTYDDDGVDMMATRTIAKVHLSFLQKQEVTLFDLQRTRLTSMTSTDGTCSLRLSTFSSWSGLVTTSVDGATTCSSKFKIASSVSISWISSSSNVSADMFSVYLKANEHDHTGITTSG